MNDPADQWDSPLEQQPMGEVPAFFRAMTGADEKIADVAALRARLASDDACPEWKPLAAGLAMLIERYYALAADADQEAAITNLAGLLRHASAFAGAVCREVEHYAKDAADANDARRAAEDRVVELSTGGAWMEHVERQRAMKRERDGECICNTGPDTDGPDEFCPWHGRPYQELTGLLTSQQDEIERLRFGIEVSTS